ncbi:TetR family transcriptional regulator [Amycolatopsis acidicola]|uniref:TetR family transcriptional regulator n=1 Tax=Amycolatopsis acidicola TaxID=2596893 RepID=A0A5N0UWY1_9PSEU|nr:TetR/AcrR family transcriptional regulator [Amycolatopsis acidicola]KAA9156692.1 TetR family transcriptional regulator [Amycolatopsis acidicola]
MSRWEPNARERLERAALELFAEHGYDNTTVAGIAERAGLTKRTFFRYFTDKREVLFYGQELLVQLFARSIAVAPESATPLQAITAALEASEAAFQPERRGLAARRQEIVAANASLREREMFKRVILTDTMGDALRERGVPDPAASVAAELGALAFGMAFRRWLDAPGEPKYGELARETLEEIRATAAGLG